MHTQNAPDNRPKRLAVRGVSLFVSYFSKRPQPWLRRPGTRPHRFRSSPRRLLWPARDQWAFWPAPQVIALRRLLNMAVAKNLDVLAAVRADRIAHVFDDAQHRGPSSSQPSERLCQRSYRRAPAGWKTIRMPSTGRVWNTVSGTSPGARGHIDKQKSTSSQITSCQNCLTAPAMTGAAPDDRGLLVFQQQVDAHDVDTGAALDRVDAVLAAGGRAVHPKQFGDGRTGDIGVQDADRMASGASQRPAWRWSCFCQRRLCRKQRR